MNNDYFRAGNPNTTQDELRQLSSNESAEVRLRLAENVKCPVDILARLSADDRPEVRAAAGTNPAAPLAVIERVARDSNAEVRLVMAAESNLPLDIIRILSNDRDSEVRERAQQTLTGMDLEAKLQESGFQKSPGDAGRLGDLIVMSGILTEDEVREYLSKARETGVPLGRVLAENKALSQALIVQLLNVQAELRRGDITSEVAIAKLEEYKTSSLAQRQTQRLQPLRAPLPADPTANLGIRSLIDAAPDGIVIFDESGIVLEWNRQAELIMGYSRRQAVGQPFSVLLDSSSDFQTNSSMKALFGPATGTEPRPPIELTTSDGRGGKTPIEITVSREESAGAPYIAFVRDVSERKKHEERRSAQFTVTRMLSDARSLSQIGPEMLHILCETTGWDTGELLLVDEAQDRLGRNAQWRAPHVGERRGPETYARGVGIPGYVWQNRRPAWIDSSTRKDRFTGGSNQTAALGLPIMFQNEFHGVLYLSSGVIRMPEKDSIEMLANCCAQIGQFIQRQNAEQARQRMLLLQQREDFMATLAHDLKTPLISGERVLELLINGSLGALQPDQARVLQMLRDSNQALLRMVKNLLSVYKYESGVEHLHLEPTDVCALIKASAEELRPMVDQKGLNLQVETPNDFEPFVCDGLELRRVVTNLLSNAIKYTGEGGQILVSLEDCPDERSVKLRVKDNGIGIPLNEQKNIFRRFWQGNQCHRAIGTGLGLHLCWKIIEAHGGKIHVESAEKQGSTFTVTLPKPQVKPIPLPVIDVKAELLAVRGARQA